MTNGDQRGWIYGYQYVCSNEDGGSYISFGSGSNTTSKWDIYLSKISSDVTAPDFEVKVNQTIAGDQLVPVVATHGSTVLVAWEGVCADNTYGISLRGFSSNGDPLTDEMKVNTYSAATTKVNARSSPGIGVNSSGVKVVVWASYDQDSSNSRCIYGQMVGSDFIKTGGEFLVNTHILNNQENPMAAMDGFGGFVVTWMGYGSSGSSYDVWLKRYDSSGTALTGDVRVNSYYLGRQHFQSMAMASDGRFVVVWQAEELGEGPNYDIYAQLYNADGTAQGSNFLVNTYTTGNETYPMVAMDDSGNFTVVWQAHGHPLDTDTCVMGQRFNSSGDKIGCEFRVNSYTSGIQEIGTISCSPSGDHWLSAWVSQGQDGSGRGVYAQLLEPYQVAPDALTVCDGASMQLTAPALAQEVSYQWLLDGSPLDGETSYTLSLASFSEPFAGEYTCQVQGTCGTDPEESLSSIIDFQALTEFTTQPQPFSGTEGDALSLSVQALGVVLSYQWQLDGEDLVEDGRISGAQSDSLAMTSLETTDGGDYTCVVETPCGAVVSEVAGVDVVVSRVDLWLAF
jgi:immunoglobulin I-set domain protein